MEIARFFNIRCVIMYCLLLMTWVLFDLLICHKMSIVFNIICHANFMCTFILRNFALHNASFISCIFAYISLNFSPRPSLIEHIQRLFTKRIRLISHLIYNEHLTHLNLHCLKCRHMYI